jgi:UDP-N-acetyl-D-mannosaminuronic acid dehydrogenase
LGGILIDQEQSLNFKKICVLGLGYIGLPTAATFAKQGLKVVGVDTNPEVVAAVNEGRALIQELGLKELVAKAVKSGNLRASETVEAADAFLIAVPTPVTDEKKADMRYVKAAAESIAPHLKKGNLVVLESTSPPRTTIELVAPILAKSGLQAGEDYYLAYSPERVLPGKILDELIGNARLAGGVNRESAEAARDLYAHFVEAPIHLTDATTAEMVKLMENTTRDVNIALANEFSHLADFFGVDVWEAIGLANEHPRINILSPGAGVGGHCIGVDPWFLVEPKPELAPLINASRRVNDAQPEYIVAMIKEAAGSLAGKKIAALGLAYKPDVDDLRESPAIEVVKQLVDTEAEVVTFEPFKVEASVEGATSAANLTEAITDADMLVLLVGHTALRMLDPIEAGAITGGKLAIDAVNGWRASYWEQAGFNVVKLGDGKRKPVPA